VLVMLLRALNVDKAQGFQTISKYQIQQQTFHPTSTSIKLHAEENPTTTEVSFTIPKMYNGELDEGVAYPSPLHTVHVRSMLSDDEATTCLRLATEYANATGCWDQPDLERHSTYSTCDFPIEDNEDLASYLHDIRFDERLKDELSELFGIQQDFMSYLDFFCANYQARNEKNENEAITTMDRLEPHRDGSLLSFTVLLNDPAEFEGGGTFFDGLRDVKGSTSEERSILYAKGVVRPKRAGDATFHSGKLLHGADVVTKGKRTVLVGFVDVAPWVQRSGVLSEACKEWGRMDVTNHLYKRQQQKTKDGTQPGWFMKNARWIYSNPEKGRGRSCLRGFAPKLKSLEQRADPEYQRMKRLEAEDKLLRTILVDEAEIEGFADIFAGGDITIL